MFGGIAPFLRYSFAKFGPVTVFTFGLDLDNALTFGLYYNF
jgi:hypothetical protein